MLARLKMKEKKGGQEKEAGRGKENINEINLMDPLMLKGP